MPPSAYLHWAAFLSYGFIRIGTDSFYMMLILGIGGICVYLRETNH